MLVLAPAVLGGCGELGYYLQSAQGQLAIGHKQRRIEAVIADPGTEPQLKAQLATALAIREFATRELALPDNASYRTYADLERPFVVWNVFAAEEFSVEARQWCFPVAGCVGYRGYFARDEAEASARELAAEGFEVFVAGVPAYSTLGFFADPVLNTFVNYPDYEVARLLFHELAHQVVYVRDDSTFNESFAATVELAGVQRWLARSGRADQQEAFCAAQRRRAEFAALVQKYRARLAGIYRSAAGAQEKRAAKAEAFASMRTEYALLKTGWGGFAGYDRFFDRLDNARLASVAMYTQLMPALQARLAAVDGELPRFYEAVRQLAALPREQRRAALEGPATPAYSCAR